MSIQNSFIPFRLIQKREENAQTNTLVFDQPLIGAQPGQFVMLWLPGVGEKPYSILNSDPLSVVVTTVGPFSEALNISETGDRIWVRGPYGQGFKLTGSRLLLAGGGYGAAPLLFLAQKARIHQLVVKVCLGARTAGDLILVEAFHNLGCEVLLSTDDGSAGKKGLVTQLVESAISNFEADALFACGPVAMLAALAVYCRQHNLASQLSWEAQMRCGIGLCGSCELDEEVRKLAGIPDGWLTCKDGPVFIKN